MNRHHLQCDEAGDEYGEEGTDEVVPVPTHGVLDDFRTPSSVLSWKQAQGCSPAVSTSARRLASEGWTVSNFSATEHDPALVHRQHRQN